MPAHKESRWSVMISGFLVLWESIGKSHHVGNEMDPSPLCHDEIAQHQTGIEERGSTYEQV
tara:strand:- start:317 stop:499 length:183 start_codon:yes stop_codon:yes gene_type:complete